MSNVSEAYESLHAHLALGQTRAERLVRLLVHPLDEAGRPSLFVRPEARALLSASMIEAAESAATIAIELFDIRWNAVVALLHNAGTCVQSATAPEIRQVVELMRLLQVRVAQLRFRRESGEMKLTLS